MSEDLPPEPRERLPAAARLYWRLVVAIRAGVALLIALALSGTADDAGIPLWLAVGGPVAIALAAVVFPPALWWLAL